MVNVVLPQRHDVGIGAGDSFNTHFDFIVAAVVQIASEETVLRVADVGERRPLPGREWPSAPDALELRS